MRLYSTRAALLAAVSLTTLPAYAQDSNDVIVVTGAPAPITIESLPAAITVIDADEARARGDIALDQALASVPGVQAPRTGPIGQQTSIFSGGFESNHTLVLFDGVRIDDPSTPESIFDAGQDTLADASRIEVVQGPLSALYGSGALGGVVNILPRRGGEGALNPRLEVATGSFETLLANAAADGALGNFRYAVTAEGYASDGYDIVPERMSVHTGEGDGASITTLTGVFDYALTDTLGVDLLLRQRKADVDFDPGFFGDIGENPEAEIASDTALWRLGATWALSDALSLRLSGGALETDRVITDAGVSGDEYHGDRDFADFTATWSIAPDWTLLLGAQTEDETIDAVNFGSSVVGEQEHWGAYVAAQGALGPLAITGAVRQDDFDGFGQEATWRAGVAYPFADIGRVYASYGTSYRAPSLFERFVPFYGNAALDPESAETWEVGGDAHFALFGRGDGLELGALYRASEIEDLIGFVGFAYGNIDEAEIEYAEARIAVRPTDWLTARVIYANTDAVNANTDVALQRRPEEAWSAELAAEHGALSGQISWRQVGSRLDTVYNDLGFWSGVAEVEAYDILRASAAWAVGDDVKLYVAADNVLDETYEPVNGFAGAPASVFVGIRVTP
ncbi:TonB-dependent receptor domain-containing protein [Vitreimonas flagellata]|uniref:TonB-dependent receptor domain-containing protein n=1 Tax=Vitreimonas flagellata TaxID=2560861 RepID=UPI001074F138|nr:TonB-dependent receptor [Vitreimonas flagellata]